MNDTISIIPIGGVGDVTRNMYVYEYKDQILIVDCGLGFADETMIGVDLLLPDISYLLSTTKKIVGLVLSHGHEDHIGGLPFLLPQLLEKNSFPIYGSPLTAAFANRKLKEFGTSVSVQTVSYDSPKVAMDSFQVEFIRVTHSIPDTSHLFIQTPAGNFYHGSDFKFDDTPWDARISNYKRIEEVGKQGIICLLSDCLGTERKGRSLTEMPIYDSFEKIMRDCNGKVLITTYSSHIARLNQIIKAARSTNRKVCFIGRSLVEAKEAAKRLKYMELEEFEEVTPDRMRDYTDKQLVLVVAGSQGQENSAMARIVNNEHKEVKLSQSDCVVFSSDPIPGNEIMVNILIDLLAKQKVAVFYPRIHDNLHVSGHGSQDDLLKLIDLTRPKRLLPIGGNYRHMALYKTLAEERGYAEKEIALVEDGQEVIFSQNDMKYGRKIPVRKVFMDEITGAEMESYVLRDRQKLSEAGVVIVLVEIDSSTGQLVVDPDTIIRGFSLENKKLSQRIGRELKKTFSKKSGLVTNWGYMRKLVGEVSERIVFRELRRRPLILPVVIEV